LRERYILELTISCNALEFLEAVKKALEPETLDVKESCIATITLEREEKSLKLVLDCSEVNDLRALFNSYYSAISMLLHVWEEETCHSNNCHQKFSKHSHSTKL